MCDFTFDVVLILCDPKQCSCIIFMMVFNINCLLYLSDANYLQLTDSGGVAFSVKFHVRRRWMFKSIFAKLESSENPVTPIGVRHTQSPRYTWGYEPRAQKINALVHGSSCRDDQLARVWVVKDSETCSGQSSPATGSMACAESWVNQARLT